MNSFDVVAFYTKNTPYEEEALKLQNNASTFNIEVRTYPYENLGKWVWNASLKAEFLQKVLNNCHKDYLIYLDVDARFRQYPKLFNTFSGDIGVHFKNGTELLSGTIFLKNCPKVKNLLDLWVEEQLQNRNIWDQKTLQKVLKASDLNVVNLPASYTQIFDSMAKYGRPVIEHMQASRKYNRAVEFKKEKIVPDKIGNIRIRRGQDGCYILPRKNKLAEEFLDQHCTRLSSQLKWLPGKHDVNNLEALRPKFKNQVVNIIGKGPSLDNLKTIPDGPIICLNESIHYIEKLELSNTIFCLQQDSRLKDICYPKRGTLLISVNAYNWYDSYNERVLVYDPKFYGVDRGELSVIVSIALSQFLEARSFNLFCFDACVNGNTNYAKTITEKSHNASWGGNPKRFLSHKLRIEKALKGYEANWITPEATA